MADLIDFYGLRVDLGQLTPRQILGLAANLDRLQAKRLLSALQASGQQLSADQVYDLVLRAYESPEAAEEAFKAVRHAELRRGETPS